MPGRTTVATSESEEMYLITIARAGEDGWVGPVPIPQVADALGVTQVAANEMVKKLVGRGFVEYVPYKGATLTSAGDAIARGVLRRRRLWGVFLTEHLGLSPAAADEVACEFEHVTPQEVESRLAAFLGGPVTGHQGRPIPQQDALDVGGPPHALADLTVGSRAVVVDVDGPDPVRRFLSGEGIVSGVELTVVGLGDGGAVLVACGGRHVELASSVATVVLVRV